MKHCTVLCRAACIVAVALVPAIVAAQHAHQHGVVNLAVAVEPTAVTLQLDAPLDSLLGFERPPRTAAEKQAAEAMLERMKSAQTLFSFDAAAKCELKSADAASDALEPGAKPSEHADLEGRFTFACADTAKLRSIGVGGLLDAFKRIQRIDAQVVTPDGQFKQRLKRPERTLRWGR